MTNEKKLELLMMDGCTKKEAKKTLEMGTDVFDDFAERFNDYMKEWRIADDEIQEYKSMIETKKPVEDWGIVEKDNHTYYIMYVL